MQKEFLTVPFEVKALDTNDDEFFYFEGYASTFGNTDLGNDIVEKGAFLESIASGKALPILWQHRMSEPIGVSVGLLEDDRGLFIKAKLPKDDDQVRGKVIPQMKVGSIREMSIGYFVKDYELKKDVRLLKKIDLFEVSLVTKAMNPKAEVTGYKSFAAAKSLPFAPRDRAWDSTAAEARIRALTNSEEKPSADYKKYFMFYDAEAPENFGSYKLLFADVVDGEPHAIPRAVFAIAGVLAGARGGVDVPSSDRARITSFVNSLYEKMAKEFEDESIVSPLAGKSDMVIESLCDVEDILRDNGFSRKQAKTIISKVKEFSAQRDAEEKEDQRDAETKKAVAELESFKSDIMQILNKF